MGHWWIMIDTPRSIIIAARSGKGPSAVDSIHPLKSISMSFITCTVVPIVVMSPVSAYTEKCATCLQCVYYYFQAQYLVSVNI